MVDPLDLLASFLSQYGGGNPYYTDTSTVGDVLGEDTMDDFRQTLIGSLEYCRSVFLSVPDPTPDAQALFVAGNEALEEAKNGADDAVLQQKLDALVTAVQNYG